MMGAGRKSYICVALLSCTETDLSAGNGLHEYHPLPVSSKQRSRSSPSAISDDCEVSA